MILPVVGPLLAPEPDVLDAIGRLRFEVWKETGLIVPEAFPDGRWLDDLDPIAWHWTMDVEGRLAGAVRYTQFDRLDDMPEAKQYRLLGLDLEGPIGVPERMVIRHEHARLGLMRHLADQTHPFARVQGARWLLMEASQATVPFLIARGRRLVGPAAHDPRFPGVHFQIVLTDMKEP